VGCDRMQYWLILLMESSIVNKFVNDMLIIWIIYNIVNNMSVRIIICPLMYKH
jgi:hypothetical protein